jgi:hypothetical protein
MSNVLTGPSVEVERALFAELLVEPARTIRVARLLGAEAIIQLSENLTFNNIFSGEVPITTDSVIYDRVGRRFEPTEVAALVDQVEVHPNV